MRKCAVKRNWRRVGYSCNAVAVEVQVSHLASLLTRWIVLQDVQALGGKVLRVDRDGNAAPGNNAPRGGDPRIFTYGHRNVQVRTSRESGRLLHLDSDCHC